MKKLFALLAVLVMVALISLAGCVTTKWVHPTKSSNDFQKDRYECEGIAQQRAYNMGGPRYAGNPFILAEEMGNCMKYHQGWNKE